MKICNEKLEGIEVSKFRDTKDVIDISGVEVNKANLKSVKLRYYKEGSLRFVDSKVTDSKMDKCLFSGSDVIFDNLTVDNCIVKGTEIDQMESFNNCKITDCKFKDCKLHMFDANDWRIEGTVFEKHNDNFLKMTNGLLKDLKYVDYTVNFSKYTKCRFENVHYDKGYISKESITECEFVNVSYSGVKFTECVFSDVDLSKVVFENCKFVNCEFNNCKATDEQLVLFGIEIPLQTMTIDEIASRFKEYTFVHRYEEIVDLSGRLPGDKWDYRVLAYVLDALNEVGKFGEALNLAREKENLCETYKMAWNRAVAKAYCGIGEYKESLRYILAGYDCTEHEKFERNDIHRFSYIVNKIDNNDSVDKEFKELYAAESERRENLYKLLDKMRQEEVRRQIEKEDSISEEDILSGEMELSEILESLESKVCCGDTLADFKETGAEYTEEQLKIYALYVYDWQVTSEGGHSDFYANEGAVSSVVYDALIMIGAQECAENLKKTFELFEDGVVPDDYQERMDAVNELSGFFGWDENGEEILSEEEECPFEEFDEFYITEHDEVMEMAYNYVLEHASKFVIKD